jgi:hypothetical protein
MKRANIYDIINVQKINAKWFFKGWVPHETFT